MTERQFDLEIQQMLRLAEAVTDTAIVPKFEYPVPPVFEIPGVMVVTTKFESEPDAHA
ncbi:MAG: hypothetical protein JNM61_10065 [Zoogloeaceae bacterium]|nr:hypothetical protein [Zoogloeaceae bacterium]